MSRGFWLHRAIAARPFRANRSECATFSRARSNDAVDDDVYRVDPTSARISRRADVAPGSRYRVRFRHGNRELSLPRMAGTSREVEGASARSCASATKASRERARTVDNEAVCQLAAGRFNP